MCYNDIERNRGGNTMSSTKEQILNFIDKCEELKNCKFIMATTKIKDLLKAIVNCPELYRLFETVTQNFDYLAEKRKALVTVDDGVYKRNCVVLPQTVGTRLAFIFCLFVEFDKDTLNFNDFLRTYFPEDGSYYASYHAFCNLIINSLQDMLRQVFREQLATPDENPAQSESGDGIQPNAEKANVLSALDLLISEEQQYIFQSKIPNDDKEGGIRMLGQLFIALKRGDEELADALICGYNYFVLFHKCVSDGVERLIETIAEYEKLL